MNMNLRNIIMIKLYFFLIHSIFKVVNCSHRDSNLRPTPYGLLPVLMVKIKLYLKNIILIHCNLLHNFTYFKIKKCNIIYIYIYIYNFFKNNFIP